MTLPEEQSEQIHEPQASPNHKLNTRTRREWQWTVRLIREWAAKHTGEIAWAFVFAVLAGYAFAIYIEDPKPYTIYVVADPDTNSEIMSKDFLPEEQKESFAKIGDVRVRVKIETLANQEAGTAK